MKTKNKWNKNTKKLQQKNILLKSILKKSIQQLANIAKRNWWQNQIKMYLQIYSVRICYTVRVLIAIYDNVSKKMQLNFSKSLPTMCI